MKFDITKKIPFEFDGWDDCYIEFRLPSFGDLKKINDSNSDDERADKGLEVIESLFIDGYAMSDGKKTQITKNDLKDLPVTFITDCFEQLAGKIPPK